MGGMNQFANFTQCGQPEEVLQVTEAPIQEPVLGELCVRMLAAPINPADVNFLQGVYGLKPVLEPASPAGLEGVGIVQKSFSADFEPGDKVILLNGVGTWAQYLTAPADNFLKVRADLDPQQAAMLKVNPLTAYLALTQYVTLKPGAWVVQNAANSGVGRCLIQLCRSMGIRTVNIVRRPDELRDELTALGADIVAGEEDENLVTSCLAQMEGARPVLASNCVGGDSATRLMDMLAPGGTMVTFGAMSKKSVKVPNGFLIFKGVRLEGLWCTQWLKKASKDDIEEAYAHLANYMAEGKLRQAVDATYALADIQEAAARAQAEFRGGKVLLDLA